MNRKMALILAAHGVALAGISFFNRSLTPGIDSWIWSVLLIGGGLCIGWGILDVFGWRRRVGPVLTLIPVIFVLIGQITSALIGFDDGQRPPPIVTALNGLMLVMSVAVVAYMVYTVQNPTVETDAGRPVQAR